MFQAANEAARSIDEITPVNNVVVTAICILAGLLCGFAHPAEETGFAFVAFFLPGIVLYLTLNQSKQVQFWNCTLFFFVINLIAMRWLCSHLYASSLIYGSYVALCFVLGLGFGLFSLIYRSYHHIGYLSVVVLPLAWCAIEWSRHFLFSGYPWLPFGVYAASNSMLLQWGSIVGVYGLSYLTMFINLLFANFLLKMCSLRGCLTVSGLILGLMIAGLGREEFFQTEPRSTTSFGAIQTGIYPHHKSYSHQYFDYWVPAESMLDDWVGIIQRANAKTILLPECVFSFSSNALHLHKGAVSLGKHSSWMGIDQQEQEIEAPFLSATNAFALLAAKFSKQIIVGLEQDEELNQMIHNHNSAYYFSTKSQEQISAKSMLVPFGEYPTWLSRISVQFAQGGEFHFGPLKKPLFELDGGDQAITTICFEDIFPHLIRKWFQGSHIHINITNDGWFLSPLLGKQHLIHSQLRSVENGITTLRVSSTGPSAHIDQFGRILHQTSASLNVLQPIPIYFEWNASTQRVFTLYAEWGEFSIFIFVLFYSFLHRLHKINLLSWLNKIIRRKFVSFF